MAKEKEERNEKGERNNLSRPSQEPSVCCYDWGISGTIAGTFYSFVIGRVSAPAKYFENAESTVEARARQLVAGSGRAELLAKTSTCFERYSRDPR